MANLINTGAQLDAAITKVNNGFRDVTGTDITAADIPIGKKAFTTAQKVENGSHSCIPKGSTIPIDKVGAGVNDIVSGKSAFVNGQIVNGVHTCSGGGVNNQPVVTVNPSSAQQSITPTAPYTGLSGVTVNAIASNFKDINTANATADDVLLGKTFLAQGCSSGAVPGSMPNNGAFASMQLSSANVEVGVARGYYSSGGTIKIDRETEELITPQFSHLNSNNYNVPHSPNRSLSVWTDVRIRKDPSLLPENILKSATIYGVPGIIEIQDKEINGSAITFSDTPNYSYPIPRPEDNTTSNVRFKNISIIKPTSLTSGNIRSGTSIMGISGALTSGVSIVSGSVNATFSQYAGSKWRAVTIVSSLGFSPKIVIATANVAGITNDKLIIINTNGYSYSTSLNNGNIDYGSLGSTRSDGFQWEFAVNYSSNPGSATLSYVAIG